MAYLTHSKYERNGIRTGANASFTSGAGGVSESTTGNMYGVFDTRGGGTEYTPCYVIDYIANQNAANISDILNETINGSTKLITLYSVRTNSKTGDAITEVSGNATYGNCSFLYGYNSASFINKGECGSPDYTYRGGIFSSNIHNCNYGNGFSARIILIP